MISYTATRCLAVLIEPQTTVKGMDACKRYKKTSVQQYFSVCVEIRRREDKASQMHKVEVRDTTPNTRGVESNDDKTHGQPKAVKRKKGRR